METHVDFDLISGLFARAMQQQRSFLYEYEVYDLIRHAGSETPPAYLFLEKQARLDGGQVDTFPGTKVVIRIVLDQRLTGNSGEGNCPLLFPSSFLSSPVKHGIRAMTRGKQIILLRCRTLLL